MIVSAPLFKNDPAPGVDEYYPINPPSIGTPYSKVDYPQNKLIPKLFQPFTLRGVEFKNRIWVSPMCQYSAVDGHMTDWHLVHLSAFAIRGPGAVILESTAVVPEGRITLRVPWDLVIYPDCADETYRRFPSFSGYDPGIQLAHAGRRASTLAPWVQARREKAGGEGSTSAVARKEEDGWPDNGLTQSYVDAVERCKKVGFDFIEIRGAHGYLLHEFCSPISNSRTDSYGGSLINHIRLPLQIVHAVRQVWDKPLFYRVSGTEYLDLEKNESGDWVSWRIEQVVELARALHKAGLDLLDVSWGGNWVGQIIPLVPGYQVPFAERIKTELPSLQVAAVGLITEPKQAEQLLQVDEKADVLFFARELMRHADFPIYAAQELGIVVKPENQYEMAWTRMMKPKN